MPDEPKKDVDMDSQAQKELKDMTRYFKEVFSQWELHPKAEWRSLQYKKAQQYANRISYAKLILELQKNPGGS